MSKAESTFKGKTVQEHYREMEQLKQEYQDWKKDLHTVKTGFFPIFTNQVKPYLKDISGNGFRLYMYLAIHSNNDTGEVIGTNLRMMEQFFDCSLRTLQNWLAELEKAKLIKRIQTKFEGSHHTFLLPYSTHAHMEWQNELKQKEKIENL